MALKYESNASRFVNIGLHTMLQYDINNTASMDDSLSDDDPKKIKTFKSYMMTLPTGDKYYFEDVHTEDDSDYCSQQTESNVFSDGIGTMHKIDSMCVPYDTDGTKMYHINKLGKSDSTYIGEYTKMLNKRYTNFVVTPIDLSVDEDNPNYMVFDTVKLYLASGFFLDYAYGIYLDIYVTDSLGKKVHICNYLLTKENNFKYQYLTDSIFFGEIIYDKFIQLRVPSVNFLAKKFVKAVSDNEYPSIIKLADLSDITSIVVEYSELEYGDVRTYDSTEGFDMEEQIKFDENDKTNDAIIFDNINKVSTALPLSANSDRITAHIEAKDGYVEFCGKWDDSIISDEIVSQFNTTYKLYNVKANRNVNLYDADADNKTEWIAYHEIRAQYYGKEILYDSNEERVLNTDTTVDDPVTQMLYQDCYTNTQVFLANQNSENPYSNNSRPLRFKPVIDNIYGYEITGVSFLYTYRLINVKDDVQFMRTASVTYEGEIADFFLNTVKLNFGDSLKTYNVYNKIENVTNKIVNGSSMTTTKYTKVYYNTSDIVLDSNGNYTASNEYVLPLSNSPKVYKFKFRRYDNDDTLIIMDLSDAVYKLYSRDADGKDIVIDATYSDNMNPVLGELEFNMSMSNINRLKAVPVANRFMSIVVVNTDGTMYSMFDFNYE